MPRAKRGSKRLDKRKKLEKLSKGYRANKSKLYRAMKEAVERGLKFAYVGRKLKKRDYRSLWIVRIGAAARGNGLSYSQFMHGLKVAGIDLDRKILADLAVTQSAAFADLASSAKKALAAVGNNNDAAKPAASAPAPAPVTEPAQAEAVPTAKLDAAQVEAAAPVAAAEARTTDLIDVEGIGPAYLKKLNAAGIFLRTELLEKGATAAGRQALAESAEISESSLARWISQVDLARVNGLTDQDAEILVAGGVDSVQALATANAEEVITKMTAINAEKNLVKQVPSAEQLGAWGAEAENLPAIVTW